MILNLTQHMATDDQKEAGVLNLPDDLREEVTALLTFEEIPTRKDMEGRAWKLAMLADEVLRTSGDDDLVMIGGLAGFMGFLEKALRSHGLRYCYAFSRRVSVEQTMPDGSVRKTATFRHAGFMPGATL